MKRLCPGDLHTEPDCVDCTAIREAGGPAGVLERAHGLVMEAFGVLGALEPGQDRDPRDARARRVEASLGMLTATTFVLESAYTGEFPDSERLIWALGRAGRSLALLTYAVELERGQEKYGGSRPVLPSHDAGREGAVTYAAPSTSTTSRTGSTETGEPTS